MKYIMLETSEGQKLPFVFPEHFIHADVALLMTELLRRRHSQEAFAVSAGFCEMSDVTVHGKSESMGDLDSRPVDAAYIELGAAVSFSPEPMAAHMLNMLRQGQR